MHDASNLDLVAHAQAGDMDAIGALYDQHHESIFKYLWARVGDRHLAEDLTGDVFLRMLSALPHYRPMGIPFRAWLYGIARHLLVDYYRKEGGRVSAPLQEADRPEEAQAEPIAEVEQRLIVEQLHGALAQLDTIQREVVAMRFLSGLSLQETAQALGKTEGAVKAIQHRGLAALRLALSQESTWVIP